INIFNSKKENFDYGNIWPTKSRDITSSLGKLGVRVVGYKTGGKKPVSKSITPGIDLIELNGKRKLDILSKFNGNHSFKDMVIIGVDIEDLEIIKHSRFSVTTSDAPLELKMESHYVSNFSGMKAFEELGNLIIHAKRDNKQHKA
ncbi:MAG: hypothetical protein ACR2NW_10650, partial [Thermodesulfobacteriota bacterium]